MKHFVIRSKKTGELHVVRLPVKKERTRDRRVIDVPVYRERRGWELIGEAPLDPDAKRPVLARFLTVVDGAVTIDAEKLAERELAVKNRQQKVKERVEKAKVRKDNIIQAYRNFDNLNDNQFRAAIKELFKDLLADKYKEVIE